jgi:DNA adenine methylase
MTQTPKAPFPQLTIDRFWAKVDTSGDCWLWTASTDRYGYGQLTVEKRHRMAHHMETYMSTTLRSPFPYFGGKSRVAPAVWSYFGNVQNYVEPFAGSLAVLLACPHPGHTETVNDADGLLCNFWRALQADPDAVAQHADYPVSELDLHARHRWLVARRADVEQLLEDPDWYDAKAAGWWVWGISQWIGSGWCSVSPKEIDRKAGSRPHLSDGGMGIHCAPAKSFGQLPHLAGDSGAAGQGVQRKSFGQLPFLAGGEYGQVQGQGIHAKFANNLTIYLRALAARLRRVRVCCGDFERVLGPSVTWRHGVSAIFLDPPYARSERADVYAVEGAHDVAERTRQWAIANGDNPLLRIALCGYGLTMPDGWSVYRWKAAGGYGGQASGRGRENAAREEVWFSPHCLYKTPIELWAEEHTS